MKTFTIYVVSSIHSALCPAAVPGDEATLALQLICPPGPHPAA